MNTIQNQAQISYISSGSTNTVQTPNVNTSIVDPNIRVVKSCCVSSAERGSTIRYTVSVINSGDIATDGNVILTDHIDKAGSHVGTTSEAWRNNVKLSLIQDLSTLTRETYYIELYDTGIASIHVTTLLPGDVIIITYSILIDVATPLIDNKLHNTVSATFQLNGKTLISRSDVCTVDIDYSKLLANKRGRAQGHDQSNLYYALELTNEGTSEASNIIITEDFPNSFQPESGFADVKKDIAIVNYIRHPNSIENVITEADNQKTDTFTLYEDLNANYYRLKAQLQDVLSKIAELSILSPDQQKASMNTTAVTLLPILEDSQVRAITAYDRLFTPDTSLPPEYNCIFQTIETLHTAVQQVKTNAASSIVPDNKDIRASFVCDAHDGGISLLNLCDSTNDAITMAAVVNQYILSISTYLANQFVTLGMDGILEYKPTYIALVAAREKARKNLALCTTSKNDVVAKTAASESLMVDVMNLAFSDTDKIKENDVDYTTTIDETLNSMKLEMKAIHISPKTVVNNVPLNGHMDIYFNGHIDMEKF